MPLTKDASGTALTTADRIDLAAATVHGPYATLAALQAAVPAAAGLAGQVARVGAAAPFVLYRCDGAAWLRQQVSADGSVVADGMTCEVAAFRLGNWSFAGGSISLPSNGVWFVGVEFWSGQLRVLPRLGHRGWIPVARVLAMGGAIASVERIEPAMPECRIPRTMAKILAGQPVHIVFQGSSLVEGTSGSTWTGHLTIGTADHYRLPGTPTYNNIARGGAPNMLGLAHSGRPLGMWGGGGFDEAGYPLETAGVKAAPTGRSAALAAADVVFVECLANGGDYRLSMIEPHVRNLRKMGLRWCW